MKIELSAAGYSGETYYGRPALKPPHWNWKVSAYVFVAGLAGGAQALAWLGGRVDRRAYAGAVRNAGGIALAATAVGAALLIADLKTPRRWYNMLRILRPTSPMSIGTYTFGAFGLFSGVGALGAGRVARLARAGAAVTGAGAATYTAALMSSTSAPYWAATPRQLGVKFAAASLGSAAAALALGERLGGRDATARRFEAVAAVAATVHLIASRDAKRQRDAAGITAAMRGAPEERAVETADLIVAGAVPLAAYALSALGRERVPVAVPMLGSVAMLAGGFLVRHALMNAGKETARRPEAQFGFAQPRNLPAPRSVPRLGP